MHQQKIQINLVHDPRGKAIFSNCSQGSFLVDSSQATTVAKEAVTSIGTVWVTCFLSGQPKIWD